MRMAVAAALCGAAAVAPASLRAETDALEARVITEDADRFAALFEETGGAPTAAQLQERYLDPGTKGIEIFTPQRIRDAENLARAIARDPSAYRRGIDVCLPIAKETSAELRAVYLALDGLLGDPALPELYTVFGAGNSGGTAAPGAQVLGLEVICRLGETEEDIRAIFRQFYAHETVHTLQASVNDRHTQDYLLSWALREGVADFIAWLVTGAVPHPERADWAQAREEEIWAEFMTDRKKVSEIEGDISAEGSPIYRWVANAGSPPEG